jgi:hypothetical protein
MSPELIEESVQFKVFRLSPDHFKEERIFQESLKSLCEKICEAVQGVLESIIEGTVTITKSTRGLVEKALRDDKIISKLQYNGYGAAIL